MGNGLPSATASLPPSQQTGGEALRIASLRRDGERVDRAAIWNDAAQPAVPVVARKPLGAARISERSRIGPPPTASPPTMTPAPQDDSTDPPTEPCAVP